MLPTAYEVQELIEEVQYHTKFRTIELRQRVGFPISRVKGHEPLSSWRIKSIGRALKWFINNNLDPFYPPAPGADREWTEVVRALRMYLTARVDHVMEWDDG